MLNRDCRLVRGATNAAIYDLTRQRIIVFPAHFADIVAALDGAPDTAVMQGQLCSFEPDIVRSVLQKLLAEDVVTLVTSSADFPDMDMTWDASGAVTNAIVDVNVQDGLPAFHAIFSEMGGLGCQFIQVRSYTPGLAPSGIEDIAAAAHNTGIRGVDVLVAFDDSLHHDDLRSLLRREMLLSRIVVHSTPSDILSAKAGHDETNSWLAHRQPVYTGQRIDSAACCGTINLRSISSPTTQVFAEMLAFNGCLNRKISVDSLGEIRNCPSFKRGFGRIGEVRLADVIKEDAFRAPWLIKKDDIEVCRDCELRYACTDCRAYTIGDGVLGKPARCGYDPYEGKWSDTVTINTPLGGFHAHAL